MKKRRDILEQKYNEYNSRYAGKSKEEMEQTIKNLSDQITEKNNLLKKTKNKEEKERIQTIINKIEKEKVNMSGYNKNKDKIEKIRNYKSRLNEKLVPLKQEKADLEKSLNSFIESEKYDLQYIDGILNDNEKSKNLTNEQYNNLVIEKQEIDAEKQKIQNKIDQVQKRIESISMATSKCDMAWRSLFTDKNWDEINLRAIKDKKYIRNKAKTNNINDIDNKKTVNKEEIENSPKQIKVNENTIEQENSEEKSLTRINEFEQKHPILFKIINKIKQVGSSIKEFFSNDSLEEEKKEVVENSSKEDRDAFIEELRRHIENDKSDKEKEYIEKHKQKVKKQEQQERD